MKDNKYFWLYIGLAVLVVVIVILYIFWDKLFPKDEKEQAQKEEQTYQEEVQQAQANNTPPPPPPTLPDGSLPVSSGDKNKKVKAMQEALIKAGAPISAGATGYFGSQTKTALEGRGYSGTSIDNPDYNDILALKKKEVTTSSTSGFSKGKLVYAAEGGKVKAKSSGGEIKEIPAYKGKLIGEVYKALGDTIYVTLDGDKTFSIYTINKSEISLT